MLRDAREASSLSVTDLSKRTRIRRGLIEAIEAEDYFSLPAPTFLRGFVVQIAKRLGLPEETVANSYVARLTTHRPGGSLH